VLTGIGPVQIVINEAPGCWVPAFQAKTASAPGGQLSAGQRIPAIPQRPLGRDVWAWATALRLDKVTADSRLGQRLAGRHGIQIRARAASAAGKTVTFADGSAAEFDAVVWATGFTADHSWIDIPEAKDDQGRILHQRGVTPSPGLYMLGRTWQHTRGSALLGWVGSDAAFLAAQIGRR
jgi:putative flavoprotein involved in K+ transport